MGGPHQVPQDDLRRNDRQTKTSFESNVRYNNQVQTDTWNLTHLQFAHFLELESASQNTCLEQHAFFWSIHWVLNMFFGIFPPSCVFDPKKVAETMKRGPTWEAPFFELGPKNFPKGPFRSKKWAPKAPIPSFLEGAPKLHPVCVFWLFL